MVVRPGWLAILSVVLGIVLSGCTGGEAASDASPAESSTQERADVITPRERVRLAAKLRTQVPCDDGDKVLDDLSFHDSMRGFDCYDRNEPTFIRVYERSTSVNQVLQDWQPTLTGGRGVLRGRNWFVIGPEASLASISPPKGYPAVAEAVGPPSEPSAREADQTTCVQFVAAWLLDSIVHDGHLEARSRDYDDALPGVTALIESIADQPKAAAVASIIDPDRRLAALSRFGPSIKAYCRDETDAGR